MKLTSVQIKNYRLLQDAFLRLDSDVTVIVGRNNTGKTSCMNLINLVLSEKAALSYDDYPLDKRNSFMSLIEGFIKHKMTYDQLRDELYSFAPSIEFYFDYSDLNEDYGALCPFIIDLEENLHDACAMVRFELAMSEERLVQIFSPCFVNTPSSILFRNVCGKYFSEMFTPKYYAAHPRKIQVVSPRTLNDFKILLPLHFITAERNLDERLGREKSSLEPLVSKMFDQEINLKDGEGNSSATLQQYLSEIESDVQVRSSEIFETTMQNSEGFGYPNSDKMKFGLLTDLKLDQMLKSNARLTYVNEAHDEYLPSSYNGLGYKNLIKILLELSSYIDKIKALSTYCCPLLLIEEPESHMHPQMQCVFIQYLNDFISSKLSSSTVRSVQSVVSTHSVHIANAVDFKNIRHTYRDKENMCTSYNDMEYFCNNNPQYEFLKKYFTISKCDIYFADKVIFVEGASERLLIPDIIHKAPDEKIHSLCNQYYTIVEVGGAHAHKFIPIMEFLKTPYLIITDIDYVDSQKEGTEYAGAKGTSNATIKYWMRKIGRDATINEILSLTEDDKTDPEKLGHIEFQNAKYDGTGRSLEDALFYVNRNTQDFPKFKENTGKVDYALGIITEFDNYCVPPYIKNGLIWLATI